MIDTVTGSTADASLDGCSRCERCSGGAGGEAHGVTVLAVAHDLARHRRLAAQRPGTARRRCRCGDRPYRCTCSPVSGVRPQSAQRCRSASSAPTPRRSRTRSSCSTWRSVDVMVLKDSVRRTRCGFLPFWTSVERHAVGELQSAQNRLAYLKAQQRSKMLTIGNDVHRRRALVSLPGAASYVLTLIGSENRSRDCPHCGGDGLCAAPRCSAPASMRHR